jgi:hypothetical protein
VVNTGAVVPPTWSNACSCRSPGSTTAPATTASVSGSPWYRPSHRPQRNRARHRRAHGGPRHHRPPPPTRQRRHPSVARHLNTCVPPSSPAPGGDLAGRRDPADDMGLVEGEPPRCRPRSRPSPTAEPDRRHRVPGAGPSDGWQGRDAPADLPARTDAGQLAALDQAGPHRAVRGDGHAVSARPDVVFGDGHVRSPSSDRARVTPSSAAGQVLLDGGWHPALASSPRR